MDGTAEVLLDPNTLSKDGTSALSGVDFSKDGKMLAYGISEKGSDWCVRDIFTAAVLVVTAKRVAAVTFLTKERNVL